MNKRKQMCIVLICNTFEYFWIRINSVTPTGDPNKHNSVISIISK